jgi:hypothetical protein
MGVFPVGPGSHTFYFVAREYSESVYASDVNLILMFHSTAMGDVSSLGPSHP